MVNYGTEFTREEECTETNELIYGVEAVVAIIHYDDGNTKANFNLDRCNYNDLRETAIDTAKSLACILSNNQVSGNLENDINNAINYIDSEGGRNSEKKIVVIQFCNPDDGCFDGTLILNSREPETEIEMIIINIGSGVNQDE